MDRASPWGVRGLCPHIRYANPCNLNQRDVSPQNIWLWEPHVRDRRGCPELRFWFPRAPAPQNAVQRQLFEKCLRLFVKKIHLLIIKASARETGPLGTLSRTQALLGTVFALPFHTASARRFTQSGHSPVTHPAKASRHAPPQSSTSPSLKPVDVSWPCALPLPH